MTGSNWEEWSKVMGEKRTERRTFSDWRGGTNCRWHEGMNTDKRSTGSEVWWRRQQTIYAQTICSDSLTSLKNKFSQTMKIQSLSAHLGKSGEVLESTKQFRRFTAKQHCRRHLTKQLKVMGTCFKHVNEKYRKKTKKMAPGVIQVSTKPEIPKIIWKYVIYTLYAQCQGFQRLGLRLTSCMEPLSLFFLFSVFPIYFSWLGDCCNVVLPAMKLHLNFHLHEGEWIMTTFPFLGEVVL